MSEMNDKDLERVTGGATAGKPFDALDWKKWNCNVCPRTECNQEAKLAMLKLARKFWEQGEEWECRLKRKQHD